MATYQLTVESLFDGEQFHSNVTVTIRDGKVQSLQPAAENCTNTMPGLLTAGFIDLQVNGGGGVLFNDSPDLKSLDQIGRAHNQFGTCGFLPTLITDSIDKMEQAADTVAAAIADNHPGVLGIHFEGPHLSTHKRGVHATRFIRELSEREMAIYQRKDLGKILLTVAPETVSPSVIAQLVANDVMVCLGHSDASSRQTRAALNAGATGFTHLFNAMSPMTSREPGMVGTALAHSDAWYGLIVDGEHVDPLSAMVAIKANSNVFLVTDAMPLVGSEQTSFPLYGKTVYRQGERLSDHEGRLAGSTLDMAKAVRNCQTMLQCSLSDALNFASANPAKFLHLHQQYGQLKAGYNASMVLLDNNNKVTAAWIDGEQTYQK